MKIIAAYESATGEGCAMKTMVWPDSVMIRSGKPLFLPEDEGGMLHFGIAARIDAVGKSILPKFAGRYFADIAPMAFVLPANVSNCLAEKSDPAACDIVADYTLVCGDFVSKETFFSQDVSGGAPLMASLDKLDSKGKSPSEITLLNINSDTDTRLREAISLASLRNTLKTGDIVCFLLPGRLKTEYDSILKIYIDPKFPLLVNKLK